MDFVVKAGFLTAAFAALGYVSKLIIEWLKFLIDEHRRRRSQLVQLESLLRASWLTYSSQAQHRNNLAALIAERTKSPLKGGESGFDQYFVDAYDTFTPAETDLHDIIRAYTMHALRMINASLLKWVQDDTYFKAQSGPKPLGQFAAKLAVLETHLILWAAKYEAWIPQFKKRSLVYLADEKNHGVGFPKGIDELIPVIQKSLDSSRLGRLERISDRLGG